jgi:hypothetical protein
VDGNRPRQGQEVFHETPAAVVPTHLERVRVREQQLETPFGRYRSEDRIGGIETEVAHEVIDPVDGSASGGRHRARGVRIHEVDGLSRRTLDPNREWKT